MLSFVITWVNLENIMLAEIKPGTEKQILYVSLTYGSLKSRIHSREQNERMNKSSQKDQSENYAKP